LQEYRYKSIQGNEIRLTTERWSHIVESHDYMAGNLDLVFETLCNPDYIVLAKSGENYAIKKYTKTTIGIKSCIVIYKDKPNGFIITALLSSKPQQFVERGEIIWKK
jgi:hypothetical protein